MYFIFHFKIFINNNASLIFHNFEQANIRMFLQISIIIFKDAYVIFVILASLTDALQTLSRSVVVIFALSKAFMIS